MVTKFALTLMFVGACLAFPVEEESRQPVVSDSRVPPAVPPQALSDAPVGPGEPHVGPGVPPQRQEPQQVAAPGDAKPDSESDLKTDNTFWYRRSYYPVYYGRSYYRPLTYSYYTYPTYYSYWW